MAMPASVLEARIHAVLPELERIYTAIRAHPELSMQESDESEPLRRPLARVFAAAAGRYVTIWSLLR